MMSIPPLPEAARAESSASVFEDFVDDAAISSLISSMPIAESVAWESRPPQPAAEDYAGWMVPERKAPRFLIKERPRRRNQPRRAQGTAQAEPGIGLPHRGPHRWWLASLAGATSTLLFAGLLFYLSENRRPHEAAASAPAPLFVLTPLPAESSAEEETAGGDFEIFNVSSVR